ncbi:hypothetical protein SAY87_023176 [Trapa incisa]|uniref:Uncharacterized protein n=1 Tax=Trapa incisa TaxID=236973 RepID=A0AAN7KBF9_9MYRT|nr:hypothetical protein SAY87_023176 [Trapa incisa]
MAPSSRIPFLGFLAVLVVFTAAFSQIALAQEAMASAPASEMTPGAATSTHPTLAVLILSSLLLSATALLNHY